MIVGSLPTTMAEYRKALEAARTEGRQQAVREIRDGVMAMQPEPLEEWRPAVLTVLSDVAGLNRGQNASEADR